MEYSFDYAMEGGIGFAIFWLIYTIFASGFSIALYVFRSLGLYAIAKNRGIRHPWFAWVPVVDQYLLGCVSDQYQYVAKGRVKNKRKSLLALNIIAWILALAIVILSVVVSVLLVGGFMGGNADMIMEEEGLTPVLIMLGLILPLMGICIAVIAVRYTALYDLYTSCSPANNVLYLVLSIFFPVTEPFFIFFNRKKEDGMPPRKRTAPEAPSCRPEPDVVHEASVERDPWDLQE